MTDLTLWGRRAAVLAAVLAMTVAPVAAQEDTPAAEPQVELAFGTGIDRTTRTVTGEAVAFASADFGDEAGQIFCLSRIRGLEAPATVTHAWYFEGKTMARVELDVGSADWRTWSSKRVLPAWKGAWEVKILDTNGMVLASSGFEIN